MIKNTFYKMNNNNNKRIALLSDIHYSRKYNNELLLQIFNNLKKNKPDFICIAGDIIDDAKTLDNETIKNRLYKFIKHLSTICDVIIIPGNHDLIEINKNKIVNRYHEEFFIKLNSIKNVHYLDNQNIIFNNINFIGFNPGINYYGEKDENKEFLLKELRQKENLFVDNKYNILLFHSPIYIMNELLINEFNSYEKIDIILSGHMHNGLVFGIFDKINTTLGFISPYMKLFPRVSRRKKEIIKNNKMISLIISGGIIKLSETTPNNLNKFNKFFSSHIEYIDI
ncbi:MAG: metallophosphoesterase [Bacilli bacterium]|nr:metallophosphoesterase [Bacilli bacterium]